MSKTCPTRVSDTHIVCSLKNLSHIRVSCPFQCCRVRATSLIVDLRAYLAVEFRKKTDLGSGQFTHKEFGK